jgi:lipoprotein-anchoring transpeptidase ErfK/SrfK
MKQSASLLLAVLSSISWTAAVPAAAVQPAHNTDPLRIEIVVPERKLYVYHGDVLYKTFDVAVGTADHPTPRGEFKIDRIIWDPSWVPPNSEWAEGEERKAPADPDNPMEAAKLFFRYPAYYIHGTNAPHSIGRAASHGCVRMLPSDVETLAELVQEHGGEPRSDAWFERVSERDEPSTEITLPEPVELIIR